MLRFEVLWNSNSLLTRFTTWPVTPVGIEPTYTLSDPRLKVWCITPISATRSWRRFLGRSWNRQTTSKWGRGDSNRLVKDDGLSWQTPPFLFLILSSDTTSIMCHVSYWYVGFAIAVAAPCEFSMLYAYMVPYVNSKQSHRDPSGDRTQNPRVKGPLL